MTDRQRTVACIALLLAYIIVRFGDLLFLGNGLFLSDISRYFYPLRHVLRETLLAGEFPWWNRYFSGGQPMAANPAYAAFYPGSLPLLLGNYRFGFNLHIVLHVCLAIVGMFLFLREDGRSRTAATIGALSFATGGYFLSALLDFSIAFIWAWTPLACFFLWRWRKTHSVRWLALAAIALAMQVLIGEPVSIVQTWILIAACAAADAIRGKRFTNNAIAFALLFVATIALSAVQVAGAMDHARDTSRREGLPYRQVARFSTAPERPLELIFPHYFGSHEDVSRNYWAGQRLDGVPYFLNIYLGLIVAVCAIAALFVRPREAIPLFALFTIVYALALGEHGTFFEMLYDAGIATRFRYPEKFLSLIILPLIWIAMRTLDDFIDGRPRARRVVIMTSAATAILTLAITAWSRSSSYLRWFFAHWSLPPAPDALRMAVLSQKYWLIAAAFVIALTLLFVSRAMLRPEIWSAAIVVFAVFDLSQVWHELTPRMPKRFFDPPGIVSVFDKPRADYTVFHLADWYLAYLDDTRFGYGRYWTTRNGLTPPTAAAWDVRTAMDRDYDETFIGPTRDMVAAMLSLNAKGDANWWRPFAAMSNVRYVLDLRDFDTVARECRGQFEFSRPVALRRFGDSAPRYFFASVLQQAGGWQDVLSIIQARGIVPRVAYVPFTPFSPAAGRVVAVEERPGDARIEVEAAGPSFLVMTVTRDRHWRVAIDGNPATVEAANIAYQGVIVPAGHHVITMRYRNNVVLAGLAISAVSMIGIIVVIASGRGWRIRSSNEQSEKT